MSGIIEVGDKELVGAHTLIGAVFKEQAADPSTPSTGQWRLYTKSGGLYLIDDAATVYGPLSNAVLASLFGANQLLYAVTPGTPVGITISQNQLVCRITGSLQGMTVEEDRLVGRVAGGVLADLARGDLASGSLDSNDVLVGFEASGALVKLGVSGFLLADGSVAMTGPLNVGSPAQSIKDNNGNWLLKWGVIGSAVNYLQFSNMSTGYGPSIAAQGTDQHIDLLLLSKGNGVVKANGSAVVRSADLINTSSGSGDAGKPIKLDAGGHVDITMINNADVDHGSIGGLGDDDHTQYHNDARGDARYYTQAQVDALIAALNKLDRGLYRKTPTASDNFRIFYTSRDITITRVRGTTDTGTVTFQVVWRPWTSPFSGGTNVLSSSLVADSDGAETTSFADATIPAGSVVCYVSSATGSGPAELEVYVEATVD